MHKALGGGSFIAGIKRVVSPNDDLDVELALGAPAVYSISWQSGSSVEGLACLSAWERKAYDS